MKHEKRTAFFRAGIVSVSAAIVYLAIFRPFSIFEVPKLKTQDLFFQARSLLPQHPQVLEEIVVVTVDDESIERLGQTWPFDRKLYADFLERILTGEPRLVGFDFVFSGEGEPSGDFSLAQALREAGNVVLSSFADDDGNYVVSTRQLRTAALASGFVNKVLDSDLYVRSVKLAYQDQAGKVVGWPWEVELAGGLGGFDRNQLAYNEDGIYAGDLQLVPAFEMGRAKINYRFRARDLNQIPFWKALETQDFGNRLRGKIVVIGATSRTLRDSLDDFFYTPLGPMPGVIVNVNFFVNLLTKDFLMKIPASVDGLVLFIFAFLASYLSLRRDVLRGFAILAAATAGLAIIFFTAFLANYLGDFFTPPLAGWVVFVSIGFARYFFTWMENIQLRAKVITDPLTGLYNRRALEARIEAELDRLARSKEGERRTDPHYELSLLMLDIDNFKSINDTYGHQSGDDVLKNVGFSIVENTRADDLAARYGGEEFCVVLPHTTKEQAVQIAEKIRAQVEASKFNYVNTVANFTVSIGVVSAKTDGLSAAKSLIQAADYALYEAKRAGKNRVCLYRHRNKSRF